MKVTFTLDAEQELAITRALTRLRRHQASTRSRNLAMKAMLCRAASAVADAPAPIGFLVSRGGIDTLRGCRLEWVPRSTIREGMIVVNRLLDIILPMMTPVQRAHVYEQFDAWTETSGVLRGKSY